MIQKYFLHQEYQIPHIQPQKTYSNHSKLTPSSSILQHSKQNYINYKTSPNLQKKPPNLSIPQNHYNVYQQPSQNYSSNQRQKVNGSRSISNGSFNTSRYSRTELSKQKQKILNEVNKNNEKLIKLKQKYSVNGINENSNHISQNLSQNRTNKLLNPSNSQNHLSHSKEKSTNNRHFKTQHHKATNNNPQYQLGRKEIKQIMDKNYITNSIQFIQNPHSENTNRFKYHQTSISPLQEYYPSNFHKNHPQTQNPHQRRTQIYRTHNSGSRDSSTVNTQKRPSSLSLDRFANKPMLTFYHCQNKKIFNYYDEGYLTDKQIQLRQKAQKAALQALDKAIQSQTQVTSRSQIQKSKSLGYFPKLNSLKQEAQKQRKRINQLYAKYHPQKSINYPPQESKPSQNQHSNHQISVQSRKMKSKHLMEKQVQRSRFQKEEKSKNKLQVGGQAPSQLPPSSTLQKKKFNVTYRSDENENILGKNEINDDSYHEREQRRIKSHFHEKQVDRLEFDRRNGSMNRRRHDLSISSRTSFCVPLIITEDSEIYNSSKEVSQSYKKDKFQKKKVPNKQQISQQNPLSFQQSYSSLTGSINSNKIPSQLSPNSKISSKKGHNLAQKLSKHGSQNERSLNNENQSNLALDSKSNIKEDPNALDMINSNYKKVTVSQQIEKESFSQDGEFLKMYTKISKQRTVLKSQSQISNLKFDSKYSKPNQEQPKDKKLHPSQKSSSYQESHLSLMSSKNIKSKNQDPKKQPIAVKKQSKVRNSQIGLQSITGANFKKKSSIQDELPQISRTSQKKVQLLVSGDMKKKYSMEPQKLVHRFKQSSKQINRQSKLQLSSKKESNSSIHSQYLQLDSALRSPKSMRQKQQSYEHQRGHKHSLSINSQKKSSQMELPMNSQSLINRKSKPSQKSQSYKISLLEQSLNELKMDSKLSHKIKNSALTCQRQMMKSKALSHRSAKTNKKIAINLDSSKQNEMNQKKYGNLLSVGNNGRNQTQSNLNPSEKNRISNLINQNYKINESQMYKNQGLKSGDYKSKNQTSKYGKSSNWGQMTYGQGQFYLGQKAQHLLQIQQELHEQRRKMQNQNEMTEQFQEVIGKIEGHIYMIREILDVAISAMEIYSQNVPWLFRSCLLCLKKYHLEKTKIVESLKGKKSCFKIAENQLTQQDLRQYLTHPQIILLAQHLSHCNSLTQKLIEEYVEYLRQYLGEGFDQNQLNMKVFDDRYDLGILLEEFRSETTRLNEKMDEESESQFDGQVQEIMRRRIFKLMEVTFLLSELTGKRIKQFTEQIDLEDQFQQYFNDYFPFFERIVKTFA